MLESLSIKNFSIIKDIEINFEPGLNVIFGESGSGKSLILHAIGIIFGENFNTSLIREDQSKSILTCYLQNYCYQRVASKSNTVSSVNGINVPVKNIKSIREEIIQIHSQGDQEEIYSKSFQLNFIDSFISEDLKKKVVASFEKYQKSVEVFEKFKSEYEIQAKQLDYYSYQIEEINKLKPFLENEEEFLENELNVIYSKEKNKESLELLRDNLSNFYELHKNILKISSKITGESKESVFSEEPLLNEEVYNDFEIKLNQLLSDSFSNKSINDINERIFFIQRLKKKLSCKNLNEVLELEIKLNNILINFENYEFEVSKYEKETNDCKKEYLDLCEIISRERDFVCREQIVPNLKSYLNLLGFEYVALEFEKSTRSQFSSNGLDDIEFKISFNKGFSTKFLRKIVSGGEASRISLAMKLINNDNRVLILDEIETGLSGETLNKLAYFLKEVSKVSQIICVTHSEEIIKHADKKIKIYKEENSEENRVETKVEETSL